jgi:hypothetical protein
LGWGCPAQGDDQARIVQPEAADPIEGHEAQDALPQRDRGRLGQARQEDRIQEPIERRDRSAHAGDRVEE